MLMVSTLSAVITFAGGYLLFRSGDYGGELLEEHLWSGVWLLVILSAAVICYQLWKLKIVAIWRTIYRICLVLAAILIIITSHLGGSITHGSDFLTEHLPTINAAGPAPVELKDRQDLLVFEDLIMPILEEKCQSCHNRYKTKGGLQMTSYQLIEKGGKSEKALLIPGEPEKSELYKRITLPDDHEDKMPPPEKSPLDETAIHLIEWWISTGASPDTVLGENPPDSIDRLMDVYLPGLFQAQRLRYRQQQELDELAKELAVLGNSLGLNIKLDGENPGQFGVSMKIPPEAVGNEQIAKLAEYAPLFSKVSLPGSDIDDDALFYLSKMDNLNKLFLPKTCITGEGLIYLQSLEHLQILNLSNSCLTNHGIMNLIKIPNLRAAYVFEVEVDSVVLQALRKTLPEVEFLEEEGAYY